MKLIQNAAECLNCGDMIVSKHVHDFVTCSCFTQNGDKTIGIFIDGGTNYRRYGGNLNHYKNISLYEFDNKNDVKE